MSSHFKRRKKKGKSLFFNMNRFQITFRFFDAETKLGVFQVQLGVIFPKSLFSLLDLQPKHYKTKF